MKRRSPPSFVFDLNPYGTVVVKDLPFSCYKFNPVTGENAKVLKSKKDVFLYDDN